MMRLRRAGDQGAVAVFFAIAAAGWVLLTSLVIIGGGRVRAHQLAYNIASEAARIGGQAIDVAGAIRGVGPKRIDPAQATLAATTYILAADPRALGTVRIVNGTTLEVSVTIFYVNPTGLPLPGGKTWTATGTATATLVIG